MGKYAVNFLDHTTSTSATTAAALIFAAGEMGEVVEFVMTGSGTTTAADTQHTALGAFFDNTCTGTYTARTAQPLNPIMNASKATSRVNYSSEPLAFDANEYVLTFGFNQRGGMRWAVPLGEGIVIHGDTAADDAFAAQVDSVAAGKVDGMLQWNEP